MLAIGLDAVLSDDELFAVHIDRDVGAFRQIREVQVVGDAEAEVVAVEHVDNAELDAANGVIGTQRIVRELARHAVGAVIEDEREVRRPRAVESERCSGFDRDGAGDVEHVVRGRVDVGGVVRAGSQQEAAGIERRCGARCSGDAEVAADVPQIGADDAGCNNDVIARDQPDLVERVGIARDRLARNGDVTRERFEGYVPVRFVVAAQSEVVVRMDFDEAATGVDGDVGRQVVNVITVSHREAAIDVGRYIEMNVAECGERQDAECSGRRSRVIGERQIAAEERAVRINDAER